MNTPDDEKMLLVEKIQSQDVQIKQHNVEKALIVAEYQRMQKANQEKIAALENDVRQLQLRIERLEAALQSSQILPDTPPTR
jgi:hypothetical protein